jgi:hypothetical protein
VQTYYRNTRPKTKKILHRHAGKRALCRYGISLNNKDFSQLVELIQTGKSQCIHVSSNTRTIHLVTYNNINYKVVYDKVRKAIITCLPHRLRNLFLTNTENCDSINKV